MYKDIFVSEDVQDYRRALATLKTWKIRMSAFYSCGLSATLALLEADVKALDARYCVEDLQVWYATAFNRFLNFAHSLTMTQCSMYGAAKELGIHTFIVDIRHLCSHGAALPSLDTFGACSEACKKWLRLFYWDNLLNETKDVTVKDLPAISGTEAITKEFRFLLSIYDLTCHQIYKRHKVVGEVAKGEITDPFSQYARSLESDNLLLIRAQLLKDCAVILENNRGKLASVHIFCRLVVEQMKYFLADAVTQNSSDNSTAELEVTVVHQNFFHMVANAGIVGEVLRTLLTTCIDSSVDEVTRNGAGYWAGQVLRTCRAYREIRRAQQKELSPEDLVKLNWDSINTKSLDKTIERAFGRMGLQRENALLFGVSKRNYWAIGFTKDFIGRQVKHTRAHNKDAHATLLYFAEPPLTDKEIKYHQQSISLFLDPLEAVKKSLEMLKSPKVTTTTAVDVPMDVFEIRELEELEELEKEKEQEKEKDEDSDGDNDGVDMGIWSCPDEGVNWERCPIGSHLWHVTAAQ